MEELGIMNFYWHLHPGSPGHSQTDEEDTFETFMGDEAQRPYFVFLQTALSDKKILKEARIDIRNPVRATILHNDINVLVERSVEEKELEEKLKKLREVVAKECEKIKEEVIIKPTYTTYGKGYDDGIYWGNDTTRQYYNKSREDYLKRYNKNHSSAFKFGIDIEELKFKFENVEDEKLRFYIDNYFIVVNNVSYSVGIEDEVSIEIKDGGIIVRAGKAFEQMLEGCLKDKDSELNKYVRANPTKDKSTKDTTQYKLQPTAGRYEELCKEIMRMFLYINSEITTEICDDNTQLALEDGRGKDGIAELVERVNGEQPVRPGMVCLDEKEQEFKVTDNNSLVSAILDVFESIGMVQIAHQDKENTVGNVIDLVSDDFKLDKDILGGFIVSKQGKDISVHGNELIYILKAAGLAP
jgi:hypothetical protein